MKVKLLHLFTGILVLGISVSGLSCQEALYNLDEQVGFEEKLAAASMLLTNSCRNFMMGEEKANGVLHFKANVAHIGTCLSSMDLSDMNVSDNPVLCRLFQAVVNLLSAQVGAKDETTLAFLDQVATRVHQHVSEQQGSEPSPSEEREKLLTSVNLEKPSFTGELVPELLRIFRVLSGARHAQLKSVQELEELSEDVGTLSSLDGASVEESEKKDETIQLYGGLVDNLTAEAIIQEEVHAFSDREKSPDMGLTATDFTVKLQEGTKFRYIDCAKILASDFLLGKIKISDLSPECFDAIDTKTVFEPIFQTAKALDALSDKVWGNMSEERLAFLFKNKFLESVQASKLKLIGLSNPGVCSVFTDSSLLEGIRNMKELSPSCVAKSISWGLLVRRIGKDGGSDMLADLTSEHFESPGTQYEARIVDENLKALAASDLTSKQWENLGKNDPTFWEKFPEDLFGILPNLASHLPRRAIEVQPELITQVDERERRKYVKSLQISIKEGQVSPPVLSILLNLDTGSETMRLFGENKNLCATYDGIASEVPNSIFNKLRSVCPGSGFRNISDEKLNEITRDCSKLTAEEIDGIGLERFLSLLDNHPQCVKSLNPELVFYIVMDLNRLNSNLGLFSPLQLSKIPEDVIKANQSALTQGQKTLILKPDSPVHYLSEILESEKQH